MKLVDDATLRITTGTGAWWGCGLEIEGKGKGENLTEFKDGDLHFEIRGDTTSNFAVGLQTGIYSDGTQQNLFATFGADQDFQLTEEWKSHTISVSDLRDGKALLDVTAPLYLRGDTKLDGKTIEVRNVYYSQPK